MRHLYFLIRFTTQTKGSHRMILDNQFTSKESFLNCRSNSFSVQILTFILRLLFPKSSQQFTSIHRPVSYTHLGHANQYQSAVSGQSYSMGGVLHRLLRNPGQSYRSLYRLSGFSIATFFGSHDVRTHFGSCCRKYRHGDGGYASARSTGHLPRQR